MNRTEAAANALRAQQAQRRAAQLKSRRERTPARVLALRKRRQYKHRLRKALGYVPAFALDTYRGFRDCLSGEPL